MRKTFHEAHTTGLALKPQSITAGSTANGESISVKPADARKLSFILLSAALTGVTVLTFAVKKSIDNAATFVAATDKAGNPLVFTASKTIAASVLDAGSLLGTLELDRFQDCTHVRLDVTVVTGATVVVAAAYVTSFHSYEPTTQDDDLLLKTFSLP